MKPASVVFLVALLTAALPSVAQPPVFDPHGDPADGVLRVVTEPPTRGQCVQCHPQHGDAASANPNILFSVNNNSLCFSTDAVSGCHASRPSTYPLRELDRLPESVADAGYFEMNTGGVRRAGLDLRGRWPGEIVYTNAATVGNAHLVSPHAFDPDMPRRDAGGEGLCLNCHDPHGTAAHDLLTAPYGGLSGHGETRAPAAYALCLGCHSNAGPPGMDVSNRTIADFYDSSVAGPNAGHRISRNPKAALFWPANVQVGDKLACYDCHGPHGSAGNDGVRPNAFLISDQRSGWSGLDDTLNDPAQTRRFCLGCHIPSDGVPGSQTVQGIVMNAISNKAPHRSTALTGCYDCHGGDYSSPAAHNVHNPR